MAKRQSLIESGPSTALLLASALERIENKDEAIDVLRAAVVRFPGDLWLNSDLANRLRSGTPNQTEDAIRYYSIFRALRPSTGTELADLLQSQKRDREAEAIRRELTKLQPDDPRTWAKLIELLKTQRERRGGSVRSAISGLPWFGNRSSSPPNEACPAPESRLASTTC